jgi:hypothetical protein
MPRDESGRNKKYKVNREKYLQEADLKQLEGRGSGSEYEKPKEWSKKKAREPVQERRFDLPRSDSED